MIRGGESGPRAAGRKLEALGARLVAHVVEHEPEDAALLGIEAARGRLRTPTPAALEAESQSLAALSREIEELTPSLEPIREAGLSGAAQLDEARADLAWMRRFVDLRAERLSSGEALFGNLELALLPYALVQHEAARACGARDIEVVGALLEAIPRFVETLSPALASPARGRRPAPCVVALFAERLLPAAAAALASLPAAPPSRDLARRSAAVALEERASSAAAALRRLAKTLDARRFEASSVLGAEQYERRVGLELGLDDSPATIARFAEDEASRAREALAEEAGRAGFGGGGLKALAGWLGERQRAHPETREAARRGLAALLAEASALVERSGAFPLPEGFSVPLLDTPPALGDAHGNWPAPLLSPQRRAAFLVAPDPAALPHYWAPVLAVHEGVPGHVLQATCWQRDPTAREGPWRHLGSADELASARHDWGPMLAIEGWAVHAEAEMDALGFFRGERRLGGLHAHLLRAVRARADVALHAEGRPLEEVAALIARGGLMPRPWAEAQVLRQLRVPGQGLTYLLGRREIEAALARLSRGRGGSAPRLDERARLLARGTLFPRLS